VVVAGAPSGKFLSFVDEWPINLKAFVRGSLNFQSYNQVRGGVGVTEGAVLYLKLPEQGVP
jgi:hypothetical protein